METENLITTGSKCSAVTIKAADVLDGCADLLEEARCRRWLIKRLHPDKINCPYCDTPAEDYQGDDLFEGKWIICKSCQKHYSAFTGTCLSGLHLRYSEFVQLCLFFAAGWPVKKIADRLKRSDSSIRSWQSRIVDRRKRSYVRRVR